jgi:hypothetical protein
MADKELVLCDTLCFLTSKMFRLSMEVLKSAVIDFYDIDTIVEAKRRLLAGVNLLDFTEKLPHIPKRRGEANRSTQEVDDIFALFQFLDERGQLSKLPRYVSSDPDSMPSTRLFEGDMSVLQAQLDKLEVSLLVFGSAIAAITVELQGIQAVQHASLSSEVLSTRNQRQANPQLNAVNKPSRPAVGGRPASDTSGKPTTSSFNSDHVISSKSWAERTSTPSNAHHNSSRPRNSTQSESTDDQALFTEVLSRKKHSRPTSNEKGKDGDQDERHQTGRNRSSSAN